MTAFHPGDEVYGMVGGVGGLQGTFAEYVVADADLLALKPKSLSMREAAALPLIGITAWEGIIDRAKGTSPCSWRRTLRIPVRLCQRPSPRSYRLIALNSGLRR